MTGELLISFYNTERFQMGESNAYYNLDSFMPCSKGTINGI